jgi:hypothetical protein
LLNLKISSSSSSAAGMIAGIIVGVVAVGFIVAGSVLAYRHISKKSITFASFLNVGLNFIKLLLQTKKS